MKRKKEAAHENHERWLVSYADFITLLFAFFVVMFATSQSDKTKAKAVSDSVRDALENGEFSRAVSVVMSHVKAEPAGPRVQPAAKSAGSAPAAAPPGVPRPADLQQSKETLEKILEPELKAGKVQIRLEARGLVVSLREAAFFASGDDAVHPASLGSLAKVAGVIRELPNPVRLEGHTDSLPIHNSRFRSNWELSAARAIAVLELLRQRFGIPPERMTVGGYAENAPVDTNDTEEGRAHNRRVDVVVLSAEGLKSEPQPAH